MLQAKLRDATGKDCAVLETKPSPMDPAHMPTWPAQGVSRVPFAVYSDPNVFAEEQHAIFRGPIWHFLGLEAQLPEPGCFVTVQVGETPVIVVRERNGTISALVNRC